MLNEILQWLHDFLDGTRMVCMTNEVFSADETCILKGHVLSICR